MISFLKNIFSKKKTKLVLYRHSTDSNLTICEDIWIDKHDKHVNKTALLDEFVYQNYNGWTLVEHD